MKKMALWLVYAGGAGMFLRSLNITSTKRGPVAALTDPRKGTGLNQSAAVPVSAVAGKFVLRCGKCYSDRVEYEDAAAEDERNLHWLVVVNCADCDACTQRRYNATQWEMIVQQLILEEAERARLLAELDQPEMDRWVERFTFALGHDGIVAFDF